MEGAQNGRATATFPNGVKCKITGSYLIDEGRDIAIIQLDLDDLPALELAEALPRKGEEVLALGSPLGLSFTATRGIVSAIRSEDEMRRDLDDSTIAGTWVQVDAPLSPGNSGGPLINKDGQLVAMSTRASFGQAQNLNFGISVVDVRAAIEEAQAKSLVDLSRGLGKINSRESQPTSGAMIKRTPVPPGAIRDYVERTKEEYSYLGKSLRREMTVQKDLFRQMRNGKIDFTLGDQIVRDSQTGRYFFPDERAKNAMVKMQEERVRDLEKLANSIVKDPTSESLFAMSWKFGPSVNMREKGSVGFLADAKVVLAATEQDVIIDYQGAPYLLWVKNSSGLFSGEMVTPAPVYVVGSKTISLPNGQTAAVTIVNTLLESELKSAIGIVGTEREVNPSVTAQSPTPESPATRSQTATPGPPRDESTTKTMVQTSAKYRKWRDSSGKYQLEATLVTRDATKVVLKKRDGSLVPIPIGKLSAFDRKYLEDLDAEEE
jgi:hypothetical protein